MANIHLNIGSNQNRRHNLSQAIFHIQKKFSNCVFSKVYESKSFGFEGEDFYNIGVNATTNLSVEPLIKCLRQIEDKLGRERSVAKFSSRLIDIDLVLYDEIIDVNYKLPRADILKYNFVLLPLAQLSPDLIHPQQNQTYAQIRVTMAGLKSYNIDILNKI